MMHYRLKFTAKLIGLLIPFVLVACGFKPMYGANSAMGADLAQIMANINIDPVRTMEGRRERLSQLIENNLRDRISPLSASGDTQYVLRSSYELEERGYGIREDESVTLQNLRLAVAFQLVDINSDQAIMEGTARSIVTYDLVQSDLSNLAARQTSLERLAEEAANQVITRIGTFLSNQQKGS